ncbi:hypothetical protein [Nisaea sediminum]|uniref:hypothetical protein n=1 Tax=Nisaea sediminum TaxID=2775867 RepID=UPI001867B843|nr:hypothetical protein [Nisaea sediminum]
MRKMHRRFLHLTGAVLLLVAVSLPAAAQTYHLFEPKTASQAKLLNLLSYYYATPERISISELLAGIEGSRILETDWENAQFPILGFLSQAFAANPGALAAEIGPTYSKRLMNIVLAALMMEFLDVYAPPAYQEIIGRVPPGKRPPHIATATVRHPKQLDMLWAALFATGDPKFLDAILKVYEDPNGPTGDPRLNLAFQKVIEWAAWSNMQQHAMVERLMRERTATAPPYIAGRLRAIVSRFEASLESLNLGTRDGLFSAMVALTDASIIEELRKPPSSGIRVVKKRRFSRQEDIFVHISFNGMEVSEDNQANVTFSSILRLPDGHEQQLYEDRTAIVGPAPVRFSILSARDLHQFRLPGDAPAGDYQLRVTLSDNLSGKDLKLTADFTLVE